MVESPRIVLREGTRRLLNLEGLSEGGNDADDDMKGCDRHWSTTDPGVACAVEDRGSPYACAGSKVGLATLTVVLKKSGDYAGMGTVDVECVPGGLGYVLITAGPEEVIG